MEEVAKKRRVIRTKEEKRVMAENTTAFATAQAETERRLRDAKSARLRALRLQQGNSPDMGRDRDA